MYFCIYLKSVSSSKFIGKQLSQYVQLKERNISIQHTFFAQIFFLLKMSERKQTCYLGLEEVRDLGQFIISRVRMPNTEDFTKFKGMFRHIA